MRSTLAASGRMWAVVCMSIALLAVMFWLNASQEEPKRTPETAKNQAQRAKEAASVAGLDAKEQARMRRMLQPLSESDADRFDRAVWTQDMRQVIGRWVKDGAEAGSVARWVYVYSKHFNISPELVLSVIAVESRFDRFAVSSAGARGLMQVMPFWKKELGSANDNLLDIETNVRYGCAILRTYMNRYGTLTRALAAYNGSLGNGTYPTRIYNQMKRFKASAEDLQADS